MATTLITDPIDWEIDEDNQLIIPIRYVTGLKAVVQAIRVRLQLWRGEWFLNLAAGMPWLTSEDGVTVTDAQAILGEQYDPIKIRSAIRSEILAVANVVDIPELTTEFDGESRVLTVRFRVLTRFGETPSDVILNLSVPVPSL